MWDDPIVEEVRNAREAHAASFNFDIDAIVKDLQMKQKEFAYKVVSFANGINKQIEKVEEPN